MNHNKDSVLLSEMKALWYEASVTLINAVTVSPSKEYFYWKKKNTRRKGVCFIITMVSFIWIQSSDQAGYVFHIICHTYQKKDYVQCDIIGCPVRTPLPFPYRHINPGFAVVEEGIEVSILIKNERKMWQP